APQRRLPPEGAPPRATSQPAPLSPARAQRCSLLMAATEAPPTATTQAPTWHMLTPEGVAQELHADPGRGLTSEEAASRLARYGPNRFAEAKTESRWHA